MQDSHSADDQYQNLEQIGQKAIVLEKVDGQKQNGTDKTDCKYFNENGVHREFWLMF